jgi:hypothetical protein
MQCRLELVAKIRHWLQLGIDFSVQSVNYDLTGEFQNELSAKGVTSVNVVM